ncbi:MAG: NAD(P)-dependent oxidoreductase [Patescibacteria group bacterium]
MDDSSIFIIGANGQLGTALRQKYPNAKSADIKELDITNKESVDTFDWTGIKTILNAAAYTNVDGAETPNGRVIAWAVNAVAIGNLVNPARRNGMTIVHISTDYVFDGTKIPHDEGEPFSPLSVYGASKAAGDLIVAGIDEHYILRTSWVIGEGKNFVRTMLELGKSGISPTVVSDQTGRPTFTSELVRAIDHLLTTKAPFGTYNVSNAGKIISWANLARKIFEIAGYDGILVTDATSQEYFASKPGVAPRPIQGALNLSKIQSTGYKSNDWQSELRSYIKEDESK